MFIPVGVEDVKADVGNNKLTVIGKVDPKAVVERVQKKSQKKDEGDGKKKPDEKENKPEEKKKEKEVYFLAYIICIL